MSFFFGSHIDGKKNHEIKISIVYKRLHNGKLMLLIIR